MSVKLVVGSRKARQLPGGPGGTEAVDAIG